MSAVQTELLRRLDGQTFLRLVAGGAAQLRANVKIVNDLNVFPIPDGDTGENMCLTIGGGLHRAQEMTGDDLCVVSEGLASGMLLSARGNSGVILSQLFAGIAAGLKSLELDNYNIGYVAAYGTDYAETCSGINAFALGAQAVNPEAIVHVNVLNAWADEINEKAMAEDLIDNYNCGVIAQHCDSAQPQIAAEAKGVFGCGYNSDMNADAPKAHLTAPIWHWNVYYQLAIETAKNDPTHFMEKVGNYYGGLKEGMVAISDLSENCAPNTKEYTDAVTELIKSGEWDVFSGVKLSFDKDGKIVKTDADLKDSAGNVIVAAGGKSVEDSVIQGSMNYYVAGVQQETGAQN